MTGVEDQGQISDFLTPVKGERLGSGPKISRSVLWYTFNGDRVCEIGGPVKVKGTAVKPYIFDISLRREGLKEYFVIILCQFYDDERKRTTCRAVWRDLK